MFPPLIIFFCPMLTYQKRYKIWPLNIGQSYSRIFRLIPDGANRHFGGHACTLEKSVFYKSDTYTHVLHFVISYENFATSPSWLFGDISVNTRRKSGKTLAASLLLEIRKFCKNHFDQKFNSNGGLFSEKNLSEAYQSRKKGKTVIKSVILNIQYFLTGKI